MGLAGVSDICVANGACSREVNYDYPITVVYSCLFANSIYNSIHLSKCSLYVT